MSGGVHSECSDETACYAALDWLSSTDITKLEEIWEQCNYVDWLSWMYARMEPTKTDVRRWSRSVEPIIRKVAEERKWSARMLQETLEGWRDERQDTVDAALLTGEPLALKEAIELCGWKLDILYDNSTSRAAGKERAERVADLLRKRIPNPWKSTRKR